MNLTPFPVFTADNCDEIAKAFFGRARALKRIG